MNYPTCTPNHAMDADVLGPMLFTAAYYLNHSHYHLVRYPQYIRLSYDAGARLVGDSRRY